MIKSVHISSSDQQTVTLPQLPNQPPHLKAKSHLSLSYLTPHHTHTHTQLFTIIILSIYVIHPSNPHNVPHFSLANACKQPWHTLPPPHHQFQASPPYTPPVDPRTNYLGYQPYARTHTDPYIKTHTLTNTCTCNINIQAIPLPPHWLWGMQGPAGGENKKTKKHTKTGNASAGAYQRALSGQWYPHWEPGWCLVLIGWSKWQLCHFRSGGRGKSRKGYKDAHLSMCVHASLSMYVCYHGYLNERNLEEMWEEIRMMTEDAERGSREK